MDWYLFSASTMVLRQCVDEAKCYSHVIAGADDGELYYGYSLDQHGAEAMRHSFGEDQAQLDV